MSSTANQNMLTQIGTYQLPSIPMLAHIGNKNHLNRSSMLRDTLRAQKNAVCASRLVLSCMRVLMVVLFCNVVALCNVCASVLFPVGKLAALNRHLRPLLCGWAQFSTRHADWRCWLHGRSRFNKRFAFSASGNQLSMLHAPKYFNRINRCDDDDE